MLGSSTAWTAGNSMGALDRWSLRRKSRKLRIVSSVITWSLCHLSRATLKGTVCVNNPYSTRTQENIRHEISAIPIQQLLRVSVNVFSRCYETCLETEGRHVDTHQYDKLNWSGEANHDKSALPAMGNGLTINCTSYRCRVWGTNFHVNVLS
jgi:hypothetical protein